MISIVVSLLLGGGSLRADPHPCQKVVDACEAKGFVRGEHKKGYGLWKDCVDPLMQHAPPRPGAKIPLPIVDPQTIASCKRAHGTNGEGERVKPPPQQ